jgi:hypothetical protein
MLNVLVRSVPTSDIMTMAAIAISAAISPYSIAVTPRLSSDRRRMIQLPALVPLVKPGNNDTQPIISISDILGGSAISSHKYFQTFNFSDLSFLFLEKHNIDGSRSNNHIAASIDEVTSILADRQVIDPSMMFFRYPG